VGNNHPRPDQYIDITGLKSGRYRLQATADASNWFTESNESNNTT
jgi:subtilase family serine protease